MKVFNMALRWFQVGHEFRIPSFPKSYRKKVGKASSISPAKTRNTLTFDLEGLCIYLEWAQVAGLAQ